MLSYVTRNETKRPEDLNALTKQERMFWEASHRSVKFRTQDSPKVYAVLKELMLGTEGDTWMENYPRQGARSYQALRRHYDGEDQKTLRIARAEADLETIHHKSEHGNFPFSVYSTRIKDLFQILEDNGIKREQSEKVKALLKKIKPEAPDYVKHAKTSLMMQTNPRPNLDSAISQLANLISEHNPQSNYPQNFRTPAGRRVAEAGTDERKRGRGDHGVDVSDPGRNFSPQEMQRLRDAGAWEGIVRARKRWRETHGDRGGRGRGGGFRGGFRGGGFRGDFRDRGRGRGRGRGNLTARIHALEASLQQANDNLSRLTDNFTAGTDPNADVPAEVGAPAPGRGGNSNASAFGSGAYRNRGGTGRGRGRGIGSYKTGNRTVSSVRPGTVSDELVTQSPANHHARMEADSHADTTIAGANMLLLAHTGLECNVHGFHDNLEPIRRVPVVTACTAYDDSQTGETIILVFNQALWFGNTMHHSLIANHQVRSNGIVLSDDPFDTGRAFGITDPESGAVVPFTMQGSFAGVRTRVPTLIEYHESPRIVMTSDAVWDPNNPTGARVSALSL